MKKLIFKLILTLFSFCFISEAFAQNFIFFYGESTFCFGSPNVPTKVGQLLNSPNRIQNYAEPSKTISMIISEQEFNANLFDFPGSIIVINTGINDAWGVRADDQPSTYQPIIYPRLPTSATSFATTLENMLNVARYRAKKVIIVKPNRLNDTSERGNIANNLLQQYDQKIDQLAITYNASVVENAVNNTSISLNMADMFHPNQAGYDRQAYAIYQKIPK